MFRRALADWKGWKLSGEQEGNSCKGVIRRAIFCQKRGLQRGVLAATYEGQHAMYSLLLTVVLKMVP
jgi:hypothetical protein